MSAKDSDSTHDNAAHSGWMTRLVRWFVCRLVGHAVFPCDRNGKSLMTRTDDGVECPCHRCGKIMRARFGLALKGLKYQPKP